MHHLQLLTTALAALVVSTSAAPTTSPNRLVRRDDWTNDKKGNVHIHFSDDTIKIGTLKIDDIMKKLSDQCADEGQCDTGDAELKAQLVGGGLGGEVDDLTITVHASGSYPSDMRDNLLDALGAALKKAAKCEDVTQEPTCPSSMSYCPSEPYTVNECVVPRFWGINYQDPKESTSAPPSISNDLTAEVDGDGFCKTFTTIGTAVAGAVNGVGGGIFTLIGLACE